MGLLRSLLTPAEEISLGGRVLYVRLYWLAPDYSLTVCDSYHDCTFSPTLAIVRFKKTFANLMGIKQELVFL